MATSVLPLPELAQRISQQQAELEKLRQLYEAQQTQLRNLTRRKEELRAQLQQVESEIHGLGLGGASPMSKTLWEATSTAKSTAASKQAHAEPVVAKPGPAKRGRKSAGGVTLAEFLLKVVSKAGRAITVKELTSEAERLKFPTTSRNLSGMIENRVSELVKKGLLRRAPDQPGVLPGKLQAAAPTPTVKNNGAMPAKSAKPTPVARNVATASSATENKLTLPAAVLKVLSQSTKPLLARELAEKVKASGYHSKSKEFINVIYVGVGKMNNVENVPGQGYRLKKGMTAAPAGKGKGSK